MAATNPFRVSDLIAKYGWKIMPYLSNLGVRSLVEAQVLFVDSGHTNALDADDTEHGHSFEKPLATLDYAIGLCTASEGAIILLAPGHVETYDDTTTGFDADVVGVTIISLGSGSLRARFDFMDSTSKCIIGANDVQIKNVVFRPFTPDVAIGLDYDSGVTGVVLEDVEFAMGEDGAGADEFIKAIHLTSGNHDCKFKNVKIFAHDSCGGATHGIHVDAASDRLVFQNVIIDGPYATGGILEDATGVNHIVEDCSIDVSGTNYSFDNSSTFAKYTRNVDAGVDTEDAEALTDVARGIGDYPTGITDNSILAYLLGKGATASASTFVNTTDSLEAISDKITAIDNTTNLNTAVPADPTARSLQDILEKDTNSNFDRADDSLEAISDALLAGTGCTAAINADSIDKLVGTSDTDQAYPASLVSHSILSSIMSSDGNPAGYDRATDSLEAIADAIDALSFATAVSQTPTVRSMQDILEKNDTGSFDDATDSLEAIADRLIDSDIDKLTSAADGGSQVYPDSVVQESVIAYILSKSANPINTSYNNTTDSLEAIRDRMDALAVADQTDIDAILLDTATTIPGTITTLQTDATAILADTVSISGGTLPATPVSGSLATYISGGSTALGQPLPASMSLIDLIGNYTGSHDEIEADDNIKAHLDLIKTDAETIISDTSAWDSSTKARTILYGSDTAGATAAKQDTAQTDLDTIAGTGGANLATATQTQVDGIEADVAIGEATGDTDIDISEADYTDYINIMTVTAPATGLANCRIDLDFNKATTGWDIISTAGDTLNAVAVVQVDGTNYRSTQKASAQITANGDASLDASESGKSFDIGPMGPNASIQIHVKLSIERDDVEIPYRVSYVGAAPTVTPVAAA